MTNTQAYFGTIQIGVISMTNTLPYFAMIQIVVMTSTLAYFLTV
jgi:hypothetical protein